MYAKCQIPTSGVVLKDSNKDKYNRLFTKSDILYGVGENRVYKIINNSPKAYETTINGERTTVEDMFFANTHTIHVYNERMYDGGTLVENANAPVSMAVNNGYYWMVDNSKHILSFTGI